MNDPPSGLRLLAESSDVPHAVGSIHVTGNVLVTVGFDTATGSRVRSFLLTDPTRPTLAAEARMTGLGRGTLDAGTLYLPRRTFPNGFSGDPSNGPGFVTYAVSPTGGLTLLHQFRMAADPVYVAARGGYAYVLDISAANGLYVVDINAPAMPIALTPAIVARLPLTGSPRTIRLDGDRAYVALAAGGVALIDISSPANPRLVSTVLAPNRSEVQDVIVSGRYVYALGTLRVTIIDVSATSGASVIGTTVLGELDTGPDIGGSTLLDSRIYGVDLLGGLFVTDVSDPSRPRAARSLTLPLQAVPLNIVARDAFFYVGTANRGVLVIAR